MAYSFTARKHLAYPNASAMVSALPQDLRELGLAEEAINEGHQDLMQPGIVDENDWSAVLEADEVTGEIFTVAPIGGAVWVPDPVLAGALMRSVHAPVALPHTAPPSLPAVNKYKAAALEAKGTTWGGDVTLTVHVGTDKGSLDEAYANPPARESTKAQVLLFVIQKTATNRYIVFPWREEQPFAAPSGPRTVLSPDTEVGVPTNTEVEPSALRPTVVELEFATSAGPEGRMQVAVLVGGVSLWGGTPLKIRQNFRLPVTFVVPAGVKWKWTEANDEGGSPTVVCTAAYSRL